MLKKEFNRKDVNRMRNLITGKTGASSEIQIGYNKKTQDYKEGDVWKENKKTWTIKKGIKQTISKLDAIKKEIFLPLCCPKCSKIMKGRFDKPNYKIHKMCHNCVIEFENKLKIDVDSNGKHTKYKEYIKRLKNKNSITIVDEMESYLLDAINTSNSEFVSENGDIERWVGGVDKEKLTKEVTQIAKERKKQLKKELGD